MGLVAGIALENHSASIGLAQPPGEQGNQEPAEAQPLSRLQKRFLTTLADEIEKSERYLERKKPEQALKFHDRAVENLQQIAGEQLPGLMSTELAPLLARLKTVRESLEGAGQKPAEMPEMSGLSGGGASGGFAPVAAILVQRCGNCHVQGSRGQFRMNTYQALMESGQVVARDPVGSRLVQVLETGEMPPNGNRIPDEEFAVIRAWVEGGAVGPEDANAPLGQLGNPDNAAATNMNRPELAAPKGNETVSFSRDIAPILADKCFGCHVGAGQPRGGLNMNTIVGLLQGGDRGPALQTGKGADSLLVKKLKGTADGQRMPQAAAPLGNDLIALVEKWIDEGATYDGEDPQLPLPTLVAVRETAAMDHEQLAVKRQAAALERWKSVFPDLDPAVMETADFQLVTSLADARREQLFQQLGGIVARLREELGVAENEPLVRGKWTVFAVPRQYDLNEFSRMVTQRPVPGGAVSMWSNDQVDAWQIVLVADTVDADMQALVLARDAAAVHFASLARGVPRWFAEGMGYVVAGRVLDKNARLKQAQAAALDFMNKASAPAVVRDPATNPAQAALGASMILAQLANKSSAIARVSSQLKEAGNFEQGFQAAFGAPVDRVFFEKPAGNNR